MLAPRLVWRSIGPVVLNCADTLVTANGTLCTKGGVIGNQLIGPYFYRENLTGERWCSTCINSVSPVENFK
uniref:Uncharacterized protein n=1 Tax=Rhodnius prolixus TaxID=13249 RepID=T1I1K6_RHOPR